MATLQTYVTATQRLLHDSNARFWSVAELTDYINDGRNRVVSDTGCNRILQTLSTVGGTAVYNYSSFPQGLSTVDVVNVNVIWNNAQRVPLLELPFTEFNLKLRAWVNYQARPVCMCNYSDNSIYLGPTPDQVYSLEMDTVCIPAALVNLTDAENVLKFPFTDPVSYYAAYKAKEKLGTTEEADRFLDYYTKKCWVARRSAQTRRLFGGIAGYSAGA